MARPTACQHPRQRSAAAPPAGALEPLEPRLLLTAALAGDAEAFAPPSPAPDLAIALFRHAAGTYLPHQPMGWWDARLANDGLVPSGPAQVEVRLSQNRTWGDPDDLVILRIDVPAGIDAISQAWAAGDPHIPWDAPGGSYYCGAMIDPDSQVAESDEADNVRWSAAPDVAVLDVRPAFDATWYATLYPDVAALASPAGPFQSVYEHFVRWGLAENRSPSYLFDRGYYLAANPDVAAVVNGGGINAFHHFLQYGQFENRDPSPFLDVSFHARQSPAAAAAPFQHFLTVGRWGGEFDPSPHFDTSFYLAANPDIAAVAAGGALSAFEHFLRYGQHEGRNPSALFDTAYYLRMAPDVAATAFPAFEHFVHWGSYEARPAQPLFSESWYLGRYDDAAAAVATGAYASGFVHFLAEGHPAGYQPSPYFEEAFYLAANPDVAAVVAGGALGSGLEHYVLYGQSEPSRRPSPYFDEAAYRAANPDVLAAIAAGVVRSGAAHFLAWGQFEARSDSVAATQVREGIRMEVWRQPIPGTSLRRFVFHFAALDPADVIAGAAASGSGHAVTGDLHQVLALSAIPTPTLTNAAYLTADERGRDTHWLLADAALLPFPEPPAESATSLGGAFAIGGLARVNALDLLQVVVQGSGTASFRLAVSRWSDASGLSHSGVFDGQLW